MFDRIRGIQFDHDCNSCVFLGNYKEHDVYFCPKDSFGGTLIFRYSSEGSEYCSSPVSVAMYSEPGIGMSDDLKKVATWLLHQGFLKIQVQEDKIKEWSELHNL